MRKSRGIEAANSWKNGGGVKKQVDANGGVSPHKAYVPPALQKQANEDLYNNMPLGQSALNTAVARETKPDLPQKLVDEFKAQPKNYPGLIAALHDGETFATCIDRWNKLGVLYAEDIIKNAPPDCPIDYHLRVAENDTQSAYGQVDK